MQKRLPLPFCTPPLLMAKWQRLFCRVPNGSFEIPCFCPISPAFLPIAGHISLFDAERHFVTPVTPVTRHISIPVTQKLVQCACVAERAWPSA